MTMTKQQDSNHHAKTVVIGFVAASVLLFIASLFLDGFYIDRPDDPRAWSPGYGLLLLGWMAVLMGVPAWLANPAVMAAWILLLVDLKRAAFAAAALAMLFALSFLLWDKIITDEAGNYSKITGYGSGYWCWVASAAMAFLGGIVAICIARKPTDESRPV